MKKYAYFRAIFIAIAYIASAYVALAQTSGWEDKGDYKEQKLIKQGLQSIAVNQDSSILYTLHNNKIVYYWDLESGELIDSLKIPDPNVSCYFAKDSKSVIYTFPSETYYLGVKSKIAIIDLYTKKQISKSVVSIPGNIPSMFPYSAPNFKEMYAFNYIIFTLVDYNSENNLFYCGFYLDFAIHMVSITSESDNTKNYGGSAIYEVKPDTLLPIKTISSIPTLDFLLTDSLEFYINYNYYYSNGRIGKEVKYSKLEQEWRGYYKNSHQEKEIMVISENNKNEYYWDVIHGEKKSQSGNDRPLTKLFYHKNSDRLFVKADSIYFCISIKNWPIVKDTIFLQKNAICEFLDDISDKLFYVSKSNIIVQDLNDKTLIETIICPIDPNNMIVLRNRKDIIITNSEGRIILLENYPTHSLPLSGWKTTSNKKEQILKIDRLEKVAWSSNAKTLYSLHDGRTVWYWDAKTGVRFDSLQVGDSSAIAIFSKDGKSVCAYSCAKNKAIPMDSVTISIYDLQTKKLISRSVLDALHSINCTLPIKPSPKIEDFYFTTLDYEAGKNTLICGISFQFNYLEGVLSNRLSAYTLGGAAEFSVYPDTLVVERQIATIKPLNILNYGNAYYATLYSNEYKRFNLGGVDSSHTACSFVLRRLGPEPNDSMDLYNKTYSKTDRFSPGKHEIDEMEGEYKPLTTLLYVGRKNAVAARAEDSYYLFDIGTEELKDTLKMPAEAFGEILNRDTSGIYYIIDKNVYLQNWFTKSVVDTIECDFAPCALSIAPEGLLVAGSHGELVIFKEKLNSAIYCEHPLLLEIRPNPARSELFLSTDGDMTGVRIEIYAQAGAKVLEAPYAERIDISSLPAGVYFLRAGNKIGKFVKE